MTSTPEQRKWMFIILEQEIELESAKAKMFQWALDHINFKKEEEEDERIQKS